MSNYAYAFHNERGGSDVLVYQDSYQKSFHIHVFKENKDFVEHHIEFNAKLCLKKLNELKNNGIRIPERTFIKLNKEIPKFEQEKD